MDERTLKTYGTLAWMLVGLLVLSGCQGAASAGTEGALAASGTIRAREIRIASELGGRIVEVRAAVGAQVGQGDALVLLDTTPLLDQLAQAEATLVTAQANLALVEAGSRPEEIDAARAALALAEAQRDGARAAWENAQEGVEEPQQLDAQIADARTTVALAGQGVELAEAQLARMQVLAGVHAEGSTERRAADLQVRAAEEALASAQADERAARTLLNGLLAIRREPLALIAQANVAEGQYRAAEAGVAVAQARVDDLLSGPTPEQVAVAEATVAQAQAQVDGIRAQLVKFTLTSPIDGVVVDRMLLPGELAAPAVTVLSVADLSQVLLDVYVPENRIGQVQLGQAVQVSVDSFPGRSFEGTVTGIGDEPEFTPRNVATQEGRLNTFYAVEVQLPNPDGLLKPGMPADAVFQELGIVFQPSQG